MSQVGSGGKGVFVWWSVDWEKNANLENRGSNGIFMNSLKMVHQLRDPRSSAWQRVCGSYQHAGHKCTPTSKVFWIRIVVSDSGWWREEPDEVWTWRWVSTQEAGVRGRLALPTVVGGDTAPDFLPAPFHHWGNPPEARARLPHPCRDLLVWQWVVYSIDMIGFGQLF